MDITPLIPAGRQVIQGYSGGIFKVNGQKFSTPICVTPERTLEWPVSTRQVPGLIITDFSLLFHKNIEFILLGCGARSHPVSQSVRQVLREQGISIETMDTGAACRTYNVLMAEGRLVSAALMPL